MVSQPAGRVAMFFCLAVLVAGCSHRVSDPPPAVKANSAARPVVFFKDGSHLVAGTAFEAEMDGSVPVILTALHIFGPDGGLSGDMPPSEIPDQVAELDLYNMDVSRQLGTGGAGLSRDGSPFGTPESSCLNDLV